MNAKFLVTGAIVGGIVIFLWGAVTHALLPPPLLEFKDEKAVVETIRANGSGNGVYFARRGMLASVAFLPDLGDKSQNVTPNLLIQFATDTLAALLLCLALAGLHADSALGHARKLAVIGLVIVALKLAPYWNWYGFSPLFIAMEALDVVGKFFIGGLVLSALMKKLAPAG